MHNAYRHTDRRNNMKTDRQSIAGVKSVTKSFAPGGHLFDYMFYHTITIIIEIPLLLLTVNCYIVIVYQQIVVVEYLSGRCPREEDYRYHQFNTSIITVIIIILAITVIIDTDISIINIISTKSSVPGGHLCDYMFYHNITIIITLNMSLLLLVVNHYIVIVYQQIIVTMS